MKKIFAIACAVLMTASAFAQDLAKATELAKKANDALMCGDSKSAIQYFTEAAKEAGASQEAEAADLVSTCKKGIVQASYKAANDLIEAGDFENALVSLAETIKQAKANDVAELAESAGEKKTQVHQALANKYLKDAKSAADAASRVELNRKAIAQLDSVLVADPQNGRVYITKGQLLGTIGQKDEAIETFTKAKEFGMEGSANKQIAGIYLKTASADLKAKKLDSAIANALKSNEYNESANAWKIAGVAANSKKDLKAASEYLKKYLVFKPDDAQIKQAVAAIDSQLKK